ncbi:hypothetical protein FDG2_0484 [Candidatus Protofrankia californiensis]|uniref:Uncharacterized protein n=2 Tax=Protofrankia TaxID=2994361 RepID=A0A1C3NTQ1_9ACTN|nr:hypothetical protein FDG2_0484 [Candidatus Protofrankia californiensis]
MASYEDQVRNRQLAVEVAGQLYAGIAVTNRYRDVDPYNRFAQIAEEVTMFASRLEEYLNAR